MTSWPQLWEKLAMKPITPKFTLRCCEPAKSPASSFEVAFAHVRSTPPQAPVSVPKFWFQDGEGLQYTTRPEPRTSQPPQGYVRRHLSLWNPPPSNMHAIKAPYIRLWTLLTRDWLPYVKPYNPTGDMFYWFIPKRNPLCIPGVDHACSCLVFSQWPSEPRPTELGTLRT